MSITVILKNNKEVIAALLNSLAAPKDKWDIDCFLCVCVYFFMFWQVLTYWSNRQLSEEEKKTNFTDKYILEW
jgi:hypothetical protein